MNLHRLYRKKLSPMLFFAATLALATGAQAANTLAVLEVKADRPTVHVLGVQMLISDDDNRNATISVRYRKAGTSNWQNALPLLRAWPETVSVPIAAQFSGSIFDLEPGTSYEIELSAKDPDGFDQTFMLTQKTRPVPIAEPANPNPVAVSNANELKAALAAAKAGDVITLANGTYAGSFFSLNASGTAENPIVLRGSSQDGVILDGQGCTGCNIVEVYGSYVHIERLTIRGGDRAIRFQGDGTTGNVARRLKIEDVIHGIGSKTGQNDFYICDNSITGRLIWPWTFAPDATSHWDDRGVDMTGDGHVICHNLLVGFGDPVVNKKNMSRAWDVYGNDIRDSYDGTELDESEGNARLFHNRFTNVMDPISIQPVRGGPVYALRNVILNAPEEQIKLKSLGGTDEPSGALIYHNTFVSAKLALNLQTPITQHNFEIKNNLFIGPTTLSGARTVDWTAKLDGGTFDANGYYPDGGFWFGNVNGQNQIWTNFADVKASGVVEQNGQLLTVPIFAAGFVGPADAMTQQPAQDFTLASGSNAIDKGVALSGINGRHVGNGPDLGAFELGCPTSVYGPRPEGKESLTNWVDCSAESMNPGTGGGGGAGGGGPSGSGGASNGAGGDSAGGNGGHSGGDDGGCACRLSGLGDAGSNASLLIGIGGLLGMALWRRRKSRR